MNSSIFVTEILQCGNVLQFLISCLMVASILLHPNDLGKIQKTSCYSKCMGEKKERKLEKAVPDMYVEIVYI